MLIQKNSKGGRRAVGKLSVLASATKYFGFGNVMSKAGSSTRNILTFDSVATTYGTILEQSLTSGDTVTVEFATTTTGSSETLFGSSGANKCIVEFDAGDLIQLTNCTATIDGNAMADGADVSSYRDGKIHTLVATANAICTVDHVGQNGSNASYWTGQMLSIATDISSTVITWDLSNGRTDYQLPVGESIGPELYTTLASWDYDGTEAQYTQIRDDVAEIGKSYLYEFVCTNYISGSIGSTAGGNFTGNMTSATTFSGLTTATGLVCRVIDNLGNSEASGTASLKELPNAIIWTNLAADQWDPSPYTYAENATYPNGAWIGSDETTILEIAA